MGYYDGALLRSPELVDAFRNDTEGIHVQAAVSLVEYGQHRVEHRHLEYLIALLLSSGESYIDFALGEFALHLHHGHLLLHHLDELSWLEIF